jgi:hypothetical protein
MDWLLRIGNGNHFKSSSKLNIWGVNSSDIYNVKPFLDSVKDGDRLWFVIGKSKGKITHVATFTKALKRDIGPLIAFTKTNKELGWDEHDGGWDTEIHFKNLYDLTDLEFLSEIKSPKVIRRYNQKCKVNLPEEYPLIVKYSKTRQLH